MHLFLRRSILLAPAILLGWACLVVAVLVFRPSFVVLADTSSTSATITATVSQTAAPVCGNGIRETGEECDDGNLIGGDGCSAECKVGSTTGSNPPPTVPVIAGVVSTTNAHTLHLDWQATDAGSVITGCVSDIGLTENYTAEVRATSTVGGFYGVTFVGLESDAAYFYRIACTNDAGTIGTYVATAHTLIDDTVPPVITAVTVTTTSRTADVTWTATDNVAVAQCSAVFDTVSLTQPGTIPVMAPVTTSTNNRYAAHIENLIPTITYHFHITCVDNIPNNAVYNGLARTQNDPTPPPDVQRLTATPLDSQAILTWVYPPNIPDTALFVIRRSTSTAPTMPDQGVLVTSTPNINVRLFHDYNLVNDVQYYYTLFVYDTSNNHSNGVSLSATPRAAGDRDGDGTNDDNDLCDANRPGMVDTVPGTIVEHSNGCPRVTLDITALTVYPALLTSVTQTPTTTIAQAYPFNGRGTLSGGFPATTWYLDARNNNVAFTIGPDGQVSWPAEMNGIYAVTYSSNGASIRVLGRQLTIDSRSLDPRNELRVASFDLGSNRFLPDVAPVSLLPNQTYWMGNRYLPAFFLTASGDVTVPAEWQNYFSYQNHTLTVMPAPLCVRPDTLTGGLRVTVSHGSSAFTDRDSVYYVLPTIDTPTRPSGVRMMYVDAAVRGTTSFFNLLSSPLQLQDVQDNERGPVVNLTLNVQNVRLNIGQCTDFVRRCGDGVLDLSEQCDDGNTNNNDGCSSQCNIEVPALCGNGLRERGEQCDDGNTVSGDGCSAVCLSEVPICGNAVVEIGEQCDDGNTANGDGCSNACQTEPPPDCGNHIIERGEQCDDGNKISHDGCSNVCLVDTPLVPTQCNDGIDNDEDGLIDLADPDCTSVDDTTEGHSTVVPDEPLGGQNTFRVQFFIASRTIPVTLEQNALGSLTGDELSILVPDSALDRGTTNLALSIDHTEYRFVLDAGTRQYHVDVALPPPGTFTARISENSSTSTIRSFYFTVNSLAYGVVRSSQDNQGALNGTATLFDGGGGLWSASTYAQVNPSPLTSGRYGFVVPNGEYILDVQSPGFTGVRRTIQVTNHVVNDTIVLDRPLKDIVNTIVDDIQNGDVGAAVSQVGALLGTFGREAYRRSVDGLSNAGKQIKAFASNPEVKKATERVVVPTVGAVAVVSILPTLPEILWPLLRYLFLQPLLLLNRRKRKEWGIVYNSLNKLGVDLATVRLIDDKTGRVVQSRVTDFAGRYIFFTDPGSYRLDIAKPGFIFPSVFLRTRKKDGDFEDLYHGETIPVADEGKAVTPNVPLDMATVTKQPHRLLWEKRFQVAQHAISLSGIVITGLSLFVTPTALVAGFFVLHCLLYVIFLRYIRPPAPKQWGTIVDMRTKKPVAKAVVRLFTKEFDRLIANQVTGKRGRYAFLTGPSTYTVSVEAPGYQQKILSDVRITDAERGFINTDIFLQPESR